MLSWIFVAFAGMFLLETALPGWQLPKARGWPVRVLVINAAQLSIVLLAGFTWERWFQHGSIFATGQSLPAPAAGVGAYFIATFVFYGGIVGATRATGYGCISTRSTTAPGDSKSRPRSTNIRWRWS